MKKIYKNEIQRLLPIFKAMAEGRTIQFAIKGNSWTDIDADEEGLFLDTLIATPQSYRIKPEPKYRPFKDAEECWKEMLKHQPFGWVMDKSWGIYDMIVRVTDSGILFNGSALKDITAYDCPFEKTSFADGTPFGILEEE